MNNYRRAIVVYSCLLFITPFIEGSFIAPLFLYQLFILFPCLALIGFFSLSGRSWWYSSLLGATWRDLVLSLPFGSTLFAIVVIGGLASLFTSWSTTRSYLTDAIAIGLIIAGGLGATLVVEAFSAYFSASTMVSFPTTATAILTVLFALIEARWLQRRVVRHQYL